MVKNKKPVRALLIIDVQNDFISGNLRVPDGKGVVPVFNQLRRKAFDYVILAFDWHPFNHCSFVTNNPGTRPFELIHLPRVGGGTQVMWSCHCIQGSHGSSCTQIS